MYSRIALISSLLAVVRGQQIGTLTAEVHPALTWQTCTAPGECTTVNGQVVLDANWRYLHAVGSSTNCYTGNTWNTTLCPDDVTCAANCALDGAAYESTYGVSTSGDALTLDFVTVSEQANVGSRLYLMASENEYQIFNVLNQEFTFDVDVSQLPCGLNGALYMSTMPADGGMAKYPTNKAGAAYGTGYCDSQCPRDLKFIDGQANSEGWVPSSNSANTGVGNTGSCCSEMDIWEANSISTAYTAHPCNTPTQVSCTGNACGGTYSTTRYAGTCDPDGCDFNSYRNGDTSFYGPGGTVNTNDVFTVVTQFLTNTGTASGTLSEIRRYYVQNGIVIPNSESTIPGIPGNSITPTYCTDESAVFNGSGSFAAHGSLPAMSAGMSAGMVLVLSLWDDYSASMLWLDSNDPPTSPASDLGVARGTCPITSGVPAQVEADSPGAHVIYSNIRFGAFNSTFTGTWPSGTGPAPSSSSSSSSAKSTTTTAVPTTMSTMKTTTTTTTSKTTTTTTTTSAAASSTGATAPHWGQCGGIGWTGPTVCAAPYNCIPQANNPYYSQCL